MVAICTPNKQLTIISPNKKTISHNHRNEKNAAVCQAVDLRQPLNNAVQDATKKNLYGKYKTKNSPKRSSVPPITTGQQVIKKET